MACNSLPSLALYVHIPWCERKCPYCDFNSHEGFDASLEEPYIDALLADLRSQQPWAFDRPLVSIFIGGGTPSLFSDRAIGRLLEGIDKQLGLPAGIEITMESNPGSAEASRYRGYRTAGVNRLSIGVQTFAATQLATLGRIHSGDQALAAIELAQQAGFERYNIDLMHGLPEQTAAEACADLDTAIAHHGGHISWYQLTIEPNTVFYRQPPVLPVEDALAGIQDEGEARLAAAGFQQYEVSAFAQPGQDSLHNRNYWTFGDYLAIGAGAHGKVSDGAGVWRFQRTRTPRDYLQTATGAAVMPPARQALDDRLLAGEFMLNVLRLKAGVATELFAARTGLSLDQVKQTIERCVADGLLVDTPNQLATTPLGFRFLNDVVGRFFPD